MSATKFKLFDSGSGGSGSSGGLSPTLTNGYTFVGNSSNVATGIPLNNFSYDITLIPDSTAVVITPGTDPTNRFTVLSWQQSSGSGTSYGDAYRVIAMQGRTKAGLKFFARGDSGFVSTVNTAPFAVTNGQTLTISIDGGGVQTITFSGLIVSGAATADEISAQISAVLVGGQAWNQQVGNTDVVRMSSDTFGVASTIQVTGGSANTGLAFPTTVQSGIDGTAMGDGQTGIQKAWVICHDKPNDLTSNNRHAHLSFEVPDSTGAMQTRLGIEYDLDITRITVSSAQFIVNENPIILSASIGSNSELWFSFDNRGQQKSRLALIRREATTGDLKFIVVNDAGVTDTLLILKRTTSTVWMDSMLQLKLGSSVARSTTLNPLVAGGNSFLVTGTGTATYMRVDNFQIGAEILLSIAAGIVLAHNGASPSPGVSVPFFLLGQANYTVGSNGAQMRFWYDGTYWRQLDISDPTLIPFTGPAVLGSVVAYNTLNTPSAITSTIGTTYLQNNAGTISWNTISGGSGITRSVNIGQSGSVTGGSTILTDYVYIFTSTGTFTFPTAIGNTNRYSIINNSGVTISFATTSSQTVQGSTTGNILNGNSLEVISDNTNYRII